MKYFDALKANVEYKLFLENIQNPSVAAPGNITIELFIESTEVNTTSNYTRLITLSDTAVEDMAVSKITISPRNLEVYSTHVYSFS